MGNAARVGLFVVAFVAMLIAAYQFLGKRLFTPPTKSYFATFEDAGGLNPGSRILMAGVAVGVVKSITLENAQLAKLNLEIQPEISIPEGTTAVLPTSLTGFGEQALILAPPKQFGGGTLPPGSTLKGVKQKALDGLLPGGEETVQELTKTLAAFRKLLEDQSLQNGIKKLMASTTGTMDKFGQTAGSVNNLIVQNQVNLQKTMASATRSMQNIEALTSDLTKLSKSGKLQGDLTATLSTIRQASEQGNQLVAELNKLVKDPEMQSAIKQSTMNLQTITESGVKMAANGEEIAKNVELMSKDGPEISKKLNDLMTKANDIASKISTIADDVKGAVGKVANVLTEGPKSPLSGLETRFDLLQESKPSFVRTDFTAIFPQSNGDSFQLGMFNAFESNQLIAQYGKRMSDDYSLRYGVFASKPGIGVDYLFGQRTLLRADVFSLNDPRFDLRFRHDFGNGVFGWLGLNRVFGDNAPVFGIGIRR